MLEAFAIITNKPTFLLSEQHKQGASQKRVFETIMDRITGPETRMPDLLPPIVVPSK